MTVYYRKFQKVNKREDPVNTRDIIRHKARKGDRMLDSLRIAPGNESPERTVTDKVNKQGYVNNFLRSSYDLQFNRRSLSQVQPGASNSTSKVNTLDSAALLGS